MYNLEEEDTLYVHFSEEGDHGFRKAEIPEFFRTDQMQSFINLVQGKGDGCDADMEDGYMNQLTLDSIIESFTEQRWTPIKQEVFHHI